MEVHTLFEYLSSDKKSAKMIEKARLDNQSIAAWK